MLRLALVFLVLAMVAGLLGFGFIASLAYDFAKVLFFFFFTLFVMALLGNMVRGGSQSSDLI